MWSKAAVLLWFCADAFAAPPACEPLDPPAFRDLSLLLRSGVDRGDDSLVGTIEAELDQRLPCLSFAPEPHAVADLLVLRAIAAYAAGGEWQPFMAAALRIWPGVDRVVSSRHPLATWEPPEADPPGPVSAGRARLYVDGLPDDHLPSPNAVALVQRTDGTWWNSVLVTPVAPLPEGWAAGPVIPPPHIAVRATTSLGAMTVARFQHADFETDWLQTLDASDALGGSVGAIADVVVTFYSPFGLLVGGSGWLLADSPGADLHAAGVWAPRHLVLGLGVGTSSVQTWEGPPNNSPLAARSGLDEIRRLYMLRYAMAVARVWWGDRTRWQLGIEGGGSQNLTRVAGHFELGLPRGDSRSRWLIGLGAASVEGRFEQVGTGPERTLSAGSTRAWLSLGLAWGGDA